MAAIEMWLRQPAAQAIGWALLQFVWQGTAVGALTALALLALRRSAADVRYVVSSIGLALMLTLAVVTGVQRYAPLASARRSEGAVAPVVERSPAAATVSIAPTDTARPVAASRAATPPSLLAGVGALRAGRVLPALLLVWLTGVTILSLRLLTGWILVRRLCTRGVSAAADGVAAAAARLARRLHIGRRVTLLVSAVVEVPTVIGFLEPVILLPIAALAGLTPQQVEAILAHELAHICRHDYLVNLLQTLVETVLFYHPAVWWLSRRIRIERENCCDDLAVRLCGDRILYAAALADLEALRAPGPARHRHVALAATGGSLLHRIRRLLGAPAPHSGRGPAWLAGAVALLLVGGIAAGTGARAQERAAAPVPAAAATPAAPAAQSVSHQANGSSGNWSWSSNGDRLDVSYAGTFEFADDDTDVRQLSAGGWLKISDGRWLFGRHAVEIRERDGRLEHRYYVNASSRPYEPEGREWLRQNLPRVVRNTGIGADTRVARLLQSGGPAAVFAEIDRIDTSYAKGVYFKQLFRQAKLTPEQYRQALTQAARGMGSSSYDLAELLIAAAAGLPADESSRAAWFQAASAIHSDYDLRRVYSTMLKSGPVSAAILGDLLAHAKAIGSDYDLSELLRQILARQPIDAANRRAFYDAVATLGGAYERHRVLSAVVRDDRATDPGMLEGALASAAGLNSDYETSTFLQQVLRQNGVEGALRQPFFATVNTLKGEYERGRVLQAVVRRGNASPDTVRDVLQSARALNGYELSQLLQLIARSGSLTGDLRDVYVSAADRLGNYDQSQALAALARSERRK